MTASSSEPLASNRKLLLRGFTLLGAIAGTVFYIGIWDWIWQIPNKQRDGFELIAAFYGTFYFFLLVVPAWYFAIKNYALWIGAICSAAALIIASDAVRPWFPWWIVNWLGI